MSFADMLLAVQLNTSRRDSAIRPRQVRALVEAIKYMHGSAHFTRDITLYNASEYIAGASTSPVTIAYPPRYRKTHQVLLKYIDQRTPTVLEQYTYAAPSMMGVALDDYFREIGGQIIVSYSSAPTNISLEYYQFPEIEVANEGAEHTDSWIVDLDDTAIVHLATSKVFNIIGDDAGMRSYLTMAEMAKNELLRNVEHLD